MTTNKPDLFAIKEQAAAWLVKMDNAELNEQESVEFQEWLSTSDFHLTYFNKLAKNWEAMGALEPLADAYPISSFKKQSASKLSIQNGAPQWFARFFSVPVLSGFAAVMVLTLAMILKPEVVETKSYSTVAGEHASYTLADGSIIMLNTDTQVTVGYSKHQRLIKLERGEANFDVAKNKERPFVVEAGGGLVWAVGTVFDVRFTDTNVDVLVSRGTVKVYSDTNAENQKLSLTAPESPSLTEAIVTAGNAIKYQKTVSKLLALSEKEKHNKMAWIEGSLIFDGETLEQAITEISRYTNNKIIIADEDIKSIRIGGHYNTNDIDALLFTLSKGFNIRVTKEAGERIILSKQ